MNSNWIKSISTVLIMACSALAAYYTTVYGLRISVNEKADRATVEQIDRRLVAIETLLRSDIAHQRDLIEMRATIDTRLTRIETLLESTHP